MHYHLRGSQARVHFLEVQQVLSTAIHAEYGNITSQISMLGICNIISIIYVSIIMSLLINSHCAAAKYVKNEFFTQKTLLLWE